MAIFFYCLEIRQIKKKDMAGSLVDTKKDGYGTPASYLNLNTFSYLCSFFFNNWNTIVPSIKNILVKFILFKG